MCGWGIWSVGMHWRAEKTRKAERERGVAEAMGGGIVQLGCTEQGLQELLQSTVRCVSLCVCGRGGGTTGVGCATGGGGIGAGVECCRVRWRVVGTRGGGGEGVLYGPGGGY